MLTHAAPPLWLILNTRHADDSGHDLLPLSPHSSMATELSNPGVNTSRKSQHSRVAPSEPSVDDGQQSGTEAFHLRSILEPVSFIDKLRLKERCGSQQRWEGWAVEEASCPTSLSISQPIILSACEVQGRAALSQQASCLSSGHSHPTRQVLAF